MEVGNFRSRCNLEMRKLSDAGSYISLLTISQYSIIYFVWLEASIFVRMPHHDLINMNALSMAEELISSCLILLHLGVKHSHVIKPHVIKEGRETPRLFHLTWCDPKHMWVKCPELESLMGSARQQWYFEYICSRLKPLLFLHLFFFIASGF